MNSLNVLLYGIVLIENIPKRLQKQANVLLKKQLKICLTKVMENYLLNNCLIHSGFPISFNALRIQFWFSFLYQKKNLR